MHTIGLTQQQWDMLVQLVAPLIIAITSFIKSHTNGQRIGVMEKKLNGVCPLLEQYPHLAKVLHDDEPH